jgi:broad-specificity NMP kinase
MSLIYITGAPGVGKTSVKEELSRRGYETHDMDDRALGGAHNRATGERVDIPSAEERSSKWYEEHQWRIDISGIQKLKDKAATKTVIVCGVAPDDESILALFDMIFYLKLDEATLKQRIVNRSDNDYGMNSYELGTIIERQKRLDLRYPTSNAILLDATKSIDAVADLIISQIQK